MGLLNDRFTTFDAFVDELGLEKIKTVGDALHGRRRSSRRPAGSCPRNCGSGAANSRTSPRATVSRARSVAIGINSGRSWPGSLGTHKFAYDLWGDAVNTASRMESGGVPDRSSQITGARTS